MNIEKKYKLTEETINVYGRTLYRIEALRDFGDVKKGDKGGFIENENNLTQYGKCWVYDNAEVSGYVARDKDGALWLYSGKPIKSRFSFVSGRFGKAVTLSDHFSKFGLNKNDYVNLKWENEPVEVFVNMKD